MPDVELAESVQPRTPPAPSRALARNVARPVVGPVPEGEPFGDEATAAVNQVADDQVAALSAVAPVEPRPAPASEARSVNAMEVATSWADMARDNLVLYWRQIGLVSAMLLGAGLLFWRLGERSRPIESDVGRQTAGDAVVVVDSEAVDETCEQTPDAVVFRSEPEPDAFDLPAIPSIRKGGPAHEGMQAEGPAMPRPERRHATLREAIEAMKAEMVRRSTVEV